MNADEIFKSNDYRKCIDFHGHTCPGLAIGYRAALTGLNKLKEKKAEDEEMVVIVENDACCVDAIQVLTGCTFGKGNLIYKDHGKMVFTFLSRNTGAGVRISKLYSIESYNEKYFSLIQKMRQNTASEEEKKEYNNLHQQRIIDILEMPEDKLFQIKNIKIILPLKAKIEKSELCDICHESTMRTKLIQTKDRQICKECYKTNQ